MGDDVVILHRCKTATARAVVVVQDCGRKLWLFWVAIDSFAAAIATVGVRKVSAFCIKGHKRSTSLDFPSISMLVARYSPVSSPNHFRWFPQVDKKTNLGIISKHVLW